ncbi:Ammonium transporter [Trichostrongylus colubriformis]|uniref:Ammonium transporter n=2 Tax=Trichostrongylus colubriformis TaxID=6319 RepID=A0AAN8EWA0_TRICO
MSMGAGDSQDDGVWMMASSFTIFTMTAGFGLLESGRVSPKDEVNVMVKNVVDVIFGGLAYWMFGYGFTFGEWLANPFIGIGDYFFDPEREEPMSTDGVAGMAERIHVQSHIFVSFFITLVHSVAGHWVWHKNGIFRAMGVIDSAGCSAVHLVGGISGLVATVYLKPRQHRFKDQRARQISDPTKAILGFLMIWWGWLAFNTSSNYSVSSHQWTEGSRSAVGTIMASVGGGMVTILISRYATRKIEVDMLIDGLLASLVSSTAGCLFYTPWQATLVGAIGSSLALTAYPVLEKAKIDDPVGVIPVHVVGSIWGMISPAIFVCRDFGLPEHKVTNENDLSGLLYGGGVTLLLYQLAALGVIAFFSACSAITILWVSLYQSLYHASTLRLTAREEDEAEKS